MNALSQRKQFGLWDSPVTPSMIAKRKGFKDVAWAGDRLIWCESRSDRSVLVAKTPGEAPCDLNAQYSPRGCVGYGGGEFFACEDRVFFVDGDSGRIFYQPIDGLAKSLTPPFGGAASPRLSPDGKWLVYVHTFADRDSLALIDATGEQWPVKIVQGDDFYMQPAWHPGGDRLAWVAWDHPKMPWDGTTLRIGRLGAPSDIYPALLDVENLAGGDRISVCQPEFSPDGRSLAYISDESGWWQIYMLDLETRQVRQLTNVEAEHATPPWVQGMRSYGFSPDGEHIFFIRNRSGYASLWRCRISDASEERIPIPETYTWLEQIAVAPDGQRVAVIASGAQTPNRIIECRLDGRVSVRAHSAPQDVPPDYYAVPETVIWQAEDGDNVHGLFYPPTNPDFEGIGLPPLVVNVHGGPTGQASMGFDAKIAFFTSRGYAYLQVNYRGSSGYGRAYRQMLHGNWGVYDVEDSLAGARWLVEHKRVDGDKLIIIGGSSGGLSVLKAVEDYPGFFKAGVCSYGISNLFDLSDETHKFEAYYNDSLLGPLPEAAQIYRTRSPIFFADRIQDPLALYHGEDDPVVSHNQSDAIAVSLRRRGIPHIYHLYPGEGHGFRKLETLEHFYASLEKFLRRYVIFA